MIATGLRDRLGRAWMLPLVGAAGILVAIAVEADPIQDIGRFVFEGAWVALGVALLQRISPRVVHGARQHGHVLSG